MSPVASADGSAQHGGMARDVAPRHRLADDVGALEVTPLPGLVAAPSRRTGGFALGLPCVPERGVTLELRCRTRSCRHLRLQRLAAAR